MGNESTAWKTCKLRDVGTVIRGASPRPQGDPRYYGGNVPRLMVKDVTRDKKYVTPRIDFLTEEGAKLSRPVKKGTLTIVCSGTVGVPAILAVDACIHDGFLAITNLNPEWDTEFLYQLLSREQQRFDKSATHGGVFTNLTTEIVKEFEIPAPPIKEQQKIAEILSCWDEGIRTSNNLLNLLELYKAVILNLVFGTEQIVKAQETEVGDLLEKIEGGGTPSRNEPKYWNGDIPWASVKDVTKGNLSSTIEFITSEGLNNSSSKLIPAGTVILVTRMAVGLPIRFNIPVAINQDLKALYPKAELSSGYLYYWTQFMGKRLASIGGGSTVNGVRLEQLRSQKIRIPSIEQQKTIENLFGQFDTQLALMTDDVACLKKQKQALMQKLLTGKIRVKV